MEPGSLLDGAEHLLCFESVGEVAALNIIVFGDLIYRVPVPIADLPRVHPAWLFDPVTARVKSAPSVLMGIYLQERQQERHGVAAKNGR
jgi:hypothetical protein